MSQPKIMLHIEGFAIFLGCIALYAHLGANGWIFLLLLLAPDLGMLGYLANETVGATVYNIVHMLALPLTLGIVALLVDAPTLLQIALIWGAHIGMDRAVGYGFKYNTAFKDTHLGRV